MNGLLIYLALYFSTAALAYPIGYTWTALEDEGVIDISGAKPDPGPFAMLLISIFCAHTVAFVLGCAHRRHNRGAC